MSKKKETTTDATNDSVVVKCKLKWAYLRKLNDMSQRYQVDCTSLDADGVKALESIGLSVRHGDDKKKPDPEAGFFITPKCTTRPPRVVDSDLNTIPDDIVDKIGNGSEAEVEIRAYIAPKADSGKAPGLQGLKLTKLVEFVETSAFSPTDGYTVPETALAGGPTKAEENDDVPF
tara:strand:- start:4165 stop:4689 length:525 start_codon:yes stop_codon:yes gene_type:complete